MCLRTPAASQLLSFLVNVTAKASFDEVDEVVWKTLERNFYQRRKGQEGRKYHSISKTVSTDWPRRPAS